MKVDCDRVIWLFVMYYIYGHVQAIPTYRVYRLYDNNIIMGCQLPVWVFCVHQPSIYVLFGCGVSTCVHVVYQFQWVMWSSNIVGLY